MLEKIARPNEVRRWPGDMPVRHRYTPGTGGDAFFTTLRERGVLLGSHCNDCGYTYVPARLFCERDFSELAADTEVGPGGELVSFTILFEGIDGEPLDLPEVIGAVRLALSSVRAVTRFNPDATMLIVTPRPIASSGRGASRRSIAAYAMPTAASAISKPSKALEKYSAFP